jgi:hypothetical protein
VFAPGQLAEKVAQAGEQILLSAQRLARERHPGMEVSTELAVQATPRTLEEQSRRAFELIVGSLGKSLGFRGRGSPRMTERKPPGMSFETWIDRQIREARERGAFDELPGAGKPLPRTDQPFSIDRWVADWARREGLDTAAMLPEPLRLRREIDRLPETVADLRSERAVRDLVDDLNEQIKTALRRPSDLPIMVFPVDPEPVVERWRASRKKDHAAPPARLVIAAPPAPKIRWWHRIFRRRRMPASPDG